MRRFLRLILPAALICGCGQPDRGQLVPVEGAVLAEGEPAAGAFVTFHPVVDQPDLIRPHAVVGEDGRFRLTTNEPDDGAPPGEYVVTVEWRGDADATIDPESAGDPPDRLGGRYAEPATSELHATVEAGAPPIVLEVAPGKAPRPSSRSDGRGR